jgi:hypothetical protein
LTDLSSKLESFIATMKQGEEFAQYGYELLIKRPRPEQYFDALNEAGFFDAKYNSGPVPSGEEGFVRVPFWSALNYLELVAKRAGELNDEQLGNKLLKIIRDVTSFRDADGKALDNFQTYYKFAEMIGALPLAVITKPDIDLAAIWLDSRFDRGLAATALSKGLLRRLLASGTKEHIEMACMLMKHLVAYRWLANEDRRGCELVTLVDDYWLKQILDRYVKELGAKAGYPAVKIFEDGLRAIFSDSRRGYGSTLWRPAIESNSQNTDFRAPENRYVEGMRDSLEGWIDVSPGDASDFVRNALKDQAEIIRRIAIHTVAEHFDLLRGAFEAIISPGFFNSGHRHELYRLLKERFVYLMPDGKKAVISALQSLPKPITGEDVDRRLKFTQREWLTAIKDQPEAATWYAELVADPALGLPSDRPDFLSYHETRMGPGPTPFGEASLISYAEDGSLIERLNSFEQKDLWNGPTLGGLVAALEAAVASSPDTFLPLLSVFHAAKLPFQYALIEGFKRVFDKARDSKPAFDWTAAWPKLINFFQEFLNNPNFWEQPSEQSVDLTPTRSWMTSLIASFLAAGTKDDETAYPPELLPKGWQLINTLLNRAADSEASLNDPMTHALNTEKGRAIGAMYNHALRVCRIAKRSEKGIAEAWATVSGTFNTEIAKCRNANFEFSTLTASYIANLEFMSVDWLTRNVRAIFPTEYPTNFKAALGGLAYATPTRRINQLLSSNGVLARALDIKVEDSHSRERITEWICLAYLWNDETLESPLMAQLLSAGAEELQTAANFFWHVHGEKLTDDQNKRVLGFWHKSIEWAKSQSVPPKQLLSTLGRLAPYLRKLDAEAKELLLAVVPYVHTDYSTDQMVEELARLVESDPHATAEILERMIDANAPNYDIDDHLKHFLEKLFALGLRTETIRTVEKLRRSLPGMVAFYKQLVSTGLSV